MSRPTPLERLGQAVADEQDQLLDEDTSLRQARARLLADAPPARSQPDSWRAPAAALCLASALVALALWARDRREAALAFQVGGSRGAVDAWIAAPRAASLPLRFSDGSAVDLGPEARARVASVAPEGARVVLERGRADVAVVHRPETRWAISAGPFEVRVTGTRFAVEWDAAREVFRLVMAEGSVEVTGACITGTSTLRAGDALALSCPARHPQPGPTARASSSGAPALALAPASAEALPIDSLPSLPPTASPPSAPAPWSPPASTESPVLPLPPPASTPSAPRPASAASAAATAAAASSPAAEPTWMALAGERRYREALAAAEAAGFESLCSSEGPEGLVRLADAARFGGSAGRARQALIALRMRFPGDARATVAAYTLGRIAFDQQGAYADAAGWFATYLSAQPSGPLAQEALGRLMEARHRSGNAAGARAAAQQYLASFASGPHADLARKLLGASSPP